MLSTIAGQRRRFGFLVAIALFSLCCAVQPVETAHALEEGSRPNIVLVVIDDGRWDTLRYMPNVRRLLVRRGIRFELGYVVDPLCCPSRATMLTGLYPHTHKVYSNKPNHDYGGFAAFDDGETIATLLQDAGYDTGLFGKYLNGYKSTYVPPGWDRWFATFKQGGFYDYEASSDGEIISYGHSPSDYGTTVIRNQVVSFIRNADDSTPLFAYVAPHAPHRPATPAPGDEQLFRSLRPLRPGSFDEADVSDKPKYIRSLEPMSSKQERKVDEFRRNQLRSLQSVDDAVARIVDALRDTGRLENTMIVFTSDHGIQWGEHRWTSKAVPYEESVRVPFVVRYDAGIEAARADDRHLVLNLDLAPTFAELGGAAPSPMEGRSMTSLFSNPSASWRSSFLIEHYSDREKGAPTFCSAHTKRWVLIEYRTGETELYDLKRDPLQLRNVADRGAYAGRQRQLVATLHRLCSPTPPGFSFAE